MIPGEIKFASAPITINEGLATKKIKAVNTGTRPIQIGSHIHFYEINEFMITAYNLTGWKRCIDLNDFFSFYFTCIFYCYMDT